MTYRYEFGSPTGSGQNFYETVNPANPSEKIGRYGIDDDASIGKMIARANKAQAEWAKVPGLERSQRLDNFIDAVEANADALATAGTLEQGKLFRESKGETLKSSSEGRFSVGEAARMGAMAIANGRGNFANQILRRPRGVIFCIAPWNFPISTPMRKICPALAFGNAVILKPSQFTPAASFLLADIAKEFFPENLVQIAMVSGRTASNIVATGDVHGVSFTGSVPTGKLVYSAAAQNLIPAQLELGGKNAAILNDTDDLDGAVSQILGAAFMTSGQRCTAISRVIVHKDLKQKATELFAAKADALKVGDGMVAETEIGPLCNETHWNDVSIVTSKAISEGAKPLCGGSKLETSEGGYYYKPTILSDVAHNSIAGQQEIFGPVLSLIDYDNFDDAMHMLNDTEFGLTSALFSNRNDLVQRFLAESQNGMIHVNHGTVPDNNMPFGGVKNSGVGAYSVGPTAVNFYTSEHSAYIKW